MSEVRERYRELELSHHGSEGRWQKMRGPFSHVPPGPLAEGEYIHQLEHKLGECIWWLTVLADRMDLSIADALDVFLTKTEKMLAKG